MNREVHIFNYHLNMEDHIATSQILISINRQKFMSRIRDQMTIWTTNSTAIKLA